MLVDTQRRVPPPALDLDSTRHVEGGGVTAVDALCEPGEMVGESTSGVRISLLGGVEVEVDGRSIGPLPRKCQELLAALALDPSSAIPVGRLVALLWGDDPPRTAEKTLQTYVARLRRELGPATIARTGSAYRLDADDQAIDTSRFRAALRRGDVEAALGEWGGTPLAGVEASGLRSLLDALVEEWLDAVESHLDVLVDKDPGGAVGSLTELVADHPFREGLWALLRLALYRTDRPAEALDAYRRARTTLVEELGVEPGQRLRDLEQSILNHDDRLGRAPGSGRLRAGRTAPTGTVTFGFVEVADVERLWADGRDSAADVLAAVSHAVVSSADANDGSIFVTGTEVIGVVFARAGDAIDWAVECRRAVAKIDAGGTSVGVRIGLHSGDADERNGTYYGPSVTIAQRIATIGSPGQIVSTHVTALLSATEPRPLGTFSVEGIVGEHDLFQLDEGDHPPLRTSSDGMFTLPPTTSPLIGREEAIVRVIDAVADSPVVTLVGPGGIGKTRLAVDAVRRRGASGGRVWFVSLAEIAEPSEVTRTVADVVVAKPAAGIRLEDAIATKLERRPSLLVLDNCEHVVDGVAELVATLSRRCPELRILATSREGLGVPVESIIAVGPLDPDGAAADLFSERARSADPEIDLDRATVDAICRRLDGVPLAIELAAARVRSIAPDELLARLNDSFRLLTGSRRRTLERHRTLHATMRWSYDLLSHDERRLFRRLAVFSGPFDLRAAEQVAADDQLLADDVGALLADLVDRSMCMVESGTTGRRFRLLEPMRQFGLDELATDDADHHLRRRHAHHIRNRITELRESLAGPEEVAGAAALAELWPNVRSAVDWAVEHGDLELAIGLVEPIAAQGFLRRGLGELGDWLARITRSTDPSDADTIGRCLFWTALYAQVTEDRTAFDRLVKELGPSANLDNPFARLAEAAVNGDSEAVLVILPAATDEAARRRDTILVRVLEILTIGNLMQARRVDDAASQLERTLSDTDRPIPPTLSTWLLYMQATLRTLRGERPGTDDPFEQIARTALPPRTNSPAPALAARRAARTGDVHGAAAQLREHVDDLAAGENLNGAIVVAVELVNILADLGRLSDAAHLLIALDDHDIDQITGMGALLADGRSRVDADPTAATIFAAAHRDDGAQSSDLLTVLSQVIDTLLSD